MDSSVELTQFAEHQRAPRWAPVLICIALTALTLIVFAQTFSFKFLNFDDNLFISENQRLTQGLSAKGVAWAFTANLTHHDPTAEYWEPLTLISRLADVQFAGMDAGAHHRTNVLLHLVAGLVLFGAVRALLRSDVKAAIIAALFLIHPLHVEPVAWLSARKDVMNGLFFFATIWAYTWYAALPSWRRYALVFLAFLGANMAKPMAVSLPFVLLLLDHWPLRRLRPPLLDRASLRVIVEKLPLLLVAVAVALLAMVDQRQHGAIGDDILYPLSVRLGNAAISFWAYLCQTVLPVNLAIYYPHPGRALNWTVAAPGVVGLILVVLLCIQQANRRPWLLVGFGWFAIVLLPVSGVVQIGEMARADRYTYVALVGIFLLVVEQLSEWPGARSRRSHSRNETVLAGGLTIAALVALTSVSYAQTQTWPDSITVFGHAVAVTSDNYIAQANLGAALFDAGDQRAGREHHREAIRIHAPVLQFHRTSGFEVERRRDFAAAIQHYGKFLTVVPWDSEVRQRLGGVLLETGEYGTALAQYNEALRYERDAIPPRIGIARALIAQRRFADARGLLDRILQQDAENHEAQELLRTIRE
ncbi:MAG: tetratricopeptide repeat protein [Chthoniobacterales bacterium]|nr:tetratricopeptide repeat protein [Chthoniobacterales bacterium]